MNKVLLLLFVFLLFINNCSSNKEEEIKLVEKKTNLKKIDKIKTVLSKQIRDEQEFNTNLEIQVSEKKFGTKSDNNKNDIGELGYKGFLEIVGKYNYKSFDNFDYVETKPIFYNENLIFFDNQC